MPSHFVRAALRIILFQLGLLLSQSGWAAIGSTATPSTVSNTFSGTITLQVTGLPVGGSVVVQKYLDLNTNGVVDAGDLLVQQFTMTDGQAGMVIGGVTNINVPGDTDTTPGQITATFNFQNGDFTQNTIGQYLYVLSSPTGSFKALTNLFTVTSTVYGQSFNGSVVNNGTNVPNAVVVLLAPRSGQLGNPVASVVANNSGNYTIQAAPGTYAFLVFKSNCLFNFKATPVPTLASGVNVTTNLTLINATATITGNLVDATNNSIGLPGIFVSANSTNEQISMGFTDTNGNFTIGVAPGSCSVNGAGSFGLIVHGYAELNNNTNVNSGASVTMVATKATALFYGSVKDASGNPVAGIAVQAHDQNNGIYDSDGYSSTNGNYVTVAVGGLGAGDPWSVGVDGSYPNYVFSSPGLDQNGGTNISVGQAALANIGALPATNFITGNVQESGTNIVGVTVSGYATVGGLTYNLNNVDTDSNGNYSLTAGNATWSIFVSCQGGSDTLDSILGPGNYQCPNNINVDITNDNGSANFNVLPGGGGGGGSATLFGNVTDTSGNNVVGVGVYASDGNGDNSSTTTDTNGGYGFNADNGNWDVSLSCSGLNSQGFACVSDQIVTIYMDSVQANFTVQFGGSSTPLGIMTSSLPDALVGTSYNQQLAASGGQTPYAWSLDSSSLALPPGVSLSTNGVISGQLVTADIAINYFLVDVTDNLGNTAQQSLSLTIYSALTISSNALPNGTAGVPYSAQILVSGGDPYSQGYYQEYFSGSFPPGLTTTDVITNSGEAFVLSGTPTNSGTFSFTIGAMDALGNFVQNNFSVTIGSSALLITTPASLADATAGVAYTNQLQASNGTPPYTWTIANGSQQPPSALTLSSAGLISGVPATSGKHSFTVKVTDSDAITTSRAFTLAINPKPSLSAAVKLSGARFQFLLSGATNQNYTVQVSTNLSSDDWTLLLLTNSAATNSFIVTDPNATNKERFYRILIGP
jgi:hypothetical protein